MARMGFVINLDTCLDMRGCVTACKMYRDTPMGVYDTETFTSNDGGFPSPNEYFIPIMCQQCTNPSCVTACEAKALVKREDGIVLISDQTACTACADPRCQVACPYGAIHHDSATKKTYKCDLCSELIDAGEKPHCVAGCLSGSRFYGDLDDNDSIVAQAIANWEGYVHQLKLDTGNAPNAYYLLSKHRWNDMDNLYTPHWHEAE